jgi:hypothetical protein
LQRNSATGQAGVSLYTKGTCTYAANWYKNSKKVRQYFSVIRYGEEQAKQLAIEACLAAKRHIPFMLRHFITGKLWYNLFFHSVSCAARSSKHFTTSRNTNKKFMWTHLTKRVTDISLRATPILQRYPDISAAYVCQDTIEVPPLVIWAVVPPSFGLSWGSLSNDLQAEFGEVDVCVASTEESLRKTVKLELVPILQKQ